MQARSLLLTGLFALLLVACSDDKETTTSDSNTGDGDGDNSSGSGTAPGDGDPGDGDPGDGDPGDGDPGDGDPGDGDPGDGDPGDGDPGDGDPGDGDPGDGDPGDGDPSCSGLNETCANDEMCCGNLDCCSGVPVPMGQEYCSDMCPISDRNKKRDFATVDTQQILDKLTELPISTWTYKDDPARTPHIGPMAQDFHATFELGERERFIFQVDADGVSLAAIQALDAKLDALEAENAQLRATVEALERRLDALER